MGVKKDIPSHLYVLRLNKTKMASRKVSGRLSDLKGMLRERRRELDGLGKRLRQDSLSGKQDLERAMRVYDEMMQERGIPDAQRAGMMHRHFGTPLPPLIRSPRDEAISALERDNKGLLGGEYYTSKRPRSTRRDRIRLLRDDVLKDHYVTSKSFDHVKRTIVKRLNQSIQPKLNPQEIGHITRHLKSIQRSSHQGGNME